MRIKKDTEIKARVDSRTKEELSHLAYVRGLDISDLLREAVRNLLAQAAASVPR